MLSEAPEDWWSFAALNSLRAQIKSDPGLRTVTTEESLVQWLTDLPHCILSACPRYALMTPTDR